MDLETCLRQLADAGVGFTVKHMSPSGEVSAEIEAAGVVRYCDDPDAFWGALYGVTPRQYRLWHDSKYAVACSGYTVRDEPCKAIVTGGSLVDTPRKWVALQGHYCHVHENGR